MDATFIGLGHTQAWNELHVKLQRMYTCLHASTTTVEREALTKHFASQLVAQAKQYSATRATAPAAAASSDTASSQTHELNSLALLAVAGVFDRLIPSRQQTAPQVREVLSLSGPLALKEDDALLSAWSLFVQQASSSLGSLGSGWPVLPAAASPAPATPTSPVRGAQRVPPGGESNSGPASPAASPALGRAELDKGDLRRNASELFSFEE